MSALNKAYHDLCDGSANQLQQLQSELAQQTEQKVFLAWGSMYYGCRLNGMKVALQIKNHVTNFP